MCDVVKIVELILCVEDMFVILCCVFIVLCNGWLCLVLVEMLWDVLDEEFFELLVYVLVVLICFVFDFDVVVCVVEWLFVVKCLVIYVGQGVYWVDVYVEL